MIVRCLACGTVYDAILAGDGLRDPCPNRYRSPHTEDFMRLVSEEIGYKEADANEHAAAISRAIEAMK